MKLYISIFILFQFSILSGQDNSYQQIDSLIETYEMLDAMTALELLKEKHSTDSLNSKYWVRTSKASLTFYDSDYAKSCMEKAVQLNPSDAETYFEKGLLYNDLNELETALAAFDKAVNFKKEGKYFFYRGILNQRLEYSLKAKSDYDAAKQRGFITAELLVNLSILQYKNKEFDEALTNINKAIELKPGYAQAHSTKSKILLFFLDLDSSCQAREKAMSLGYKNVMNIPDSVCNGNEAIQLDFLAEIMAIESLYEQSILVYSKLIDKKHLKGNHFLNRGFCYYNLGKLDLAEKDYLAALTYKDVNMDQLFENISLLYFDKEAYGKSIKYSTKRIEFDPTNPAPYIDRGLCHRLMKNYKEAEKDFNQSLAINPQYFRGYAYRAYLFLDLGENQKAIDDAEKAISINPNYGYAYLILGQAKLILKRPDYCLDFFSANKFGNPDAKVLIDKFCD